MFDPARDGMSLLKMGDEVRFVPITTDQFAEL
jgi:allophanate hydrolase subunit 1